MQINHQVICMSEYMLYFSYINIYTVNNIRVRFNNIKIIYFNSEVH